MIRTCIAAVGLLAVAVGQRCIAPDEIEPGMKGYGFSVFSGDSLERFDVEVVDVMEDFFPKSDLILCRFSGANLEHTGIVAGMSGSPVYLDGKLAGAMAYAWGFAKEPLAGVTPIAEMLTLWRIDSAAGARSVGRQGRAGPGQHSELRPLAIPVAMTDLTPALSRLVSPAFEELGMFPCAAGAHSGTGESDGSRLVPGSACGVTLTDGDVTMAAIGTLTHRDGDRILAFGHPMFLAGAVDLPLCAGRIHCVMPSLASSFKLFSIGENVGTVTQDRLPGIAGVLGPVPEMTPVRVKLASPVANDSFDFRVIRERTLASLLVAIGAADAVYSTEGGLEYRTLYSTMSVRALAGPDTLTLTIRHAFCGPDPAADLFRTAEQGLRALLENRFEPVELAGVDFSLAFATAERRTRVVSCRPDRLRYAPGDTVLLNLELVDAQGKATGHQVRFALPPTLAEGSLTVVVGSRDSLEYRETMRVPSRAEPRSLADLVQNLERTGRENELVVAGFSAQSGMTVANLELPAPPPSWHRVIMAASEQDPVVATNATLVSEQALETEHVIAGTYELTLEVKR